MTDGREKAKQGTNIALNAPVMITYPTALALTAGLVSVGLNSLLAALVVSTVVYALDWASREDE